MFYNTAGTSVTAYASAAARSTIEQLRNLFVWIFFMVFMIQGRYAENFSWIQLSGFGILLLGILTFNEIIYTPLSAEDIEFQRKLT